jgi:hypothetical protein
MTNREIMVAAVAAMRKRGMTYSQIEGLTGIERSTAYYMLHPRPKVDRTDYARIRRKRERKERIVVMHLEGYSHAKIAEAVKSTPHAIYHVLKKLREAEGYALSPVAGKS